MSRYLLLVLLNLPFIVAALISALTQYKLGKLSLGRFLAQVFFWVLIVTGLCLAHPIYTWLFSHNLTETEPLSLFDVVQLTAIIVLFYAVNRTRGRVDVLEQRLRSLHEELSIRLSK